MYPSVALLAGLLLIYSLIASRVERTWISGAMIFAGFGVLIGPLALNLFDLPVTSATLQAMAELTLALMLFSDAANIDLKRLRLASVLPVRLLLIGLPLTIALGYAAGLALFPQLGWVEVALLATMLAPTDAALGSAVVSNKNVPEPIREGLTVESGLNDGICVPILLLFLALAGKTALGESSSRLAIGLFVEEIGIGAAVGIGASILGAALIRLSVSRHSIEGAWKQIPVVALSLLCFAAAQWIGGSGFIAAFVGGLVFGSLIPGHREHVLEAAEGTGNAFSAVTWVIFGAGVIGQMTDRLDPHALIYAILSLTLVRILPVFICLIGYRATLGEKLFIGWFGPRGLASIVFCVIVLNANIPGGGRLAIVLVYTVVLSILLHGITANPWAAALARRVRTRAVS